MSATLIDLWPAVAAARAAFLQAIEDVTEEQALLHPGGEPAEWCVLQVAQHLLGWTENVDDVICALAEGRAAAKHPRGYLPSDPPATLAEVRSALVHASARFLALPARLPAHADPSPTVPHEVYGALNYLDWFARSAPHDADHQQQVLAIRRGW
ncbi:MAG: DinB family protein [Dehalococcoidia bacterium]